MLIPIKYGNQKSLDWLGNWKLISSTETPDTSWRIKSPQQKTLQQDNTCPGADCLPRKYQVQYTHHTGVINDVEQQYVIV